LDHDAWLVINLAARARDSNSANSSGTGLLRSDTRAWLHKGEAQAVGQRDGNDDSEPKTGCGQLGGLARQGLSAVRTAERADGDVNPVSTTWPGEWAWPSDRHPVHGSDAIQGNGSGGGLGQRHRRRLVVATARRRRLRSAETRDINAKRPWAGPVTNRMRPCTLFKANRTFPLFIFFKPLKI
jgi:hypothetical protein